MLNGCGVGRAGTGASACGKGKFRVPVTLDVPTLRPFSVPPGPQSGQWRNTNVLPPPSALLLEGLFLLWLTFSLLFVFKKQLFQLFLSQPSKKDPGRQRRRPLGQRAAFMCDPAADRAEVEKKDRTTRRAASGTVGKQVLGSGGQWFCCDIPPLDLPM